MTDDITLQGHKRVRKNSTLTMDQFKKMENFIYITRLGSFIPISFIK